MPVHPARAAHWQRHIEHGEPMPRLGGGGQGRIGRERTFSGETNEPAHLPRQLAQNYTPGPHRNGCIMESLDLAPRPLARGTVQLPGSKSISNRALLLAALAKGRTRLTGLLDSDDTRVMRDALAKFGVNCSPFGERRD